MSETKPSTISEENPTYSFPESTRNPLVDSNSQRQQQHHLRSASHGSSVYTSSSFVRPSALKSSASSRGHQRALSQGQIPEGKCPDTSVSAATAPSSASVHRPGHSRVSSKTDFILPPGHRDDDGATTATGNILGSATASKSHSRQASRSESIYTLRHSLPPPWWQTLLYHLLRRKAQHEPEERHRIVVPNHMVPPKTPRKQHPNGQRPNNRIRTTKYTLLSFLPRNLLEQFHRVANLYFIFIVLLNWFPAINAFGKEIAMIPVIFVLGVTAVKDLFEDRRRHASDKRINNSTCRIYNSEAARYKKVLWKDVRVGDLIHLSNNEIVPADILLLRSSDPSGLCYIDTGHLDGETNLKQRQVARGFTEKQDVFQPSKFISRIEVDAPNTKIYRFHGAIIHPSGERIPVGTDNLLLRECLLKNTDFIEGIVVYAGRETKAMLNNGGPRYKRSSLERLINQDVIWCVIILILLCLIGAIGCKLSLSIFESMDVPFKSGNSDGVEAFLSFWMYIIMLQIMIPLSLYVTLEMCKIVQVYHIHHNVDLYDELTDKRTECRALNITEELGQVQYIFSDKTGTLTENRMIFRRCSIAGVDYNHPKLQYDVKNLTKFNSLSVAVNPRLANDLQLRNCDSGGGGEVSEHLVCPTRNLHASKIQEFFLLLAVCNTVVCSRHPHHDSMNASGIIEQVPPPTAPNGKSTTTTTSSSSSSSSSDDSLKKHDNSSSDQYLQLQESRSITPSPRWYDRTPPPPPPNSKHVTILSPISSVASSPVIEPPPVIVKRPNLLNIVPSNLINVMSRKVVQTCDQKTATISNSSTKTSSSSATSSPNQEVKPIFEAESPDELALVDAAYNYNCRLVKRTPTTIAVEFFDQGRYNFDVLNVLPFDSNRKRMSIIIKRPYSGEICLLCKGADSAILTNLAQNIDTVDQQQNSNIIEKTQQHIGMYARNGLRVLLMAKRIISKHEYDEWNRIKCEIETCLENQENRLQEHYSRIESHLQLLGATGIEDRLQDGVPETINDLLSAGIAIWVLTGDKPETAINIAYSCRLFSPQMEILKLMTRSKQTAERTIFFYLSEIEQQHCSPIKSAVTKGNRRILRTNGGGGKALVIDGKTLTFILDRRSNLTKPFLKLTTYCNSVLCCRATPLQKACIVRIVKEELKKRTLAIGDGANDVSMIQTADVGIGISGQEGMQAVMAADFSLPRFKFLQSLLLVHGHWSYDRLSRMVLYFFYKNAAFVFLTFWYQLYCGFSGAVMIDQMYLMLYNLLFTSFPPLAIGVYDQDAPDVLLKDKPYLYRKGRLGKVYRSYSFWLTMMDAFYQSVCIFFVCHGVYVDSDIDIFEFGTTATTACMFVMLLHVALEIRSWTIIHVGSILMSIGAFYVYSFLYNTLCVSCFGLPSTYWVIHKATVRPTYWLITLLSCVLSLLPRYVFRVVKTLLWPDEVHRAVIEHRRAFSRRGERFLVSWSRLSSTSSIYRTDDCRSQTNILTMEGRSA